MLLHWSLPLGMLLFGRATVGGALGFVALILVHELGHHALVRSRSLRTIEISMHWLGGECRYGATWGSAYDHAIIAWGGVLAQAIVFALALTVARVLEPAPGVLADVLFVLLVPNAGMALLNLLPIAGLDGSLAWRLPGMLVQRARRRRAERTHEKLRTELARIERERRERSLH